MAKSEQRHAPNQKFRDPVDRKNAISNRAIKATAPAIVLAGRPKLIDTTTKREITRNCVRMLNRILDGSPAERLLLRVVLRESSSN